jgi:hypothetical protein
MLSAHLLSMDPHLLLLLLGLLVLRKEPDAWLLCGGPQQGRRDGKKHQSVLWRRYVGDGDTTGHHVAPSRAWESRASPSARGNVALVEGFLKDGVLMFSINLMIYVLDQLQEHVPSYWNNR